jgi:hypothetical protein
MGLQSPGNWKAAIIWISLRECKILRIMKYDAKWFVNICENRGPKTGPYETPENIPKRGGANYRNSDKRLGVA